MKQSGPPNKAEKRFLELIFNHIETKDSEELTRAKKRLRNQLSALRQYETVFDELQDNAKRTCQDCPTCEVNVPDAPRLCKICSYDTSFDNDNLTCHGRKCLFTLFADPLPCSMCIEDAESKGEEITLNYCTKCKRRICLKCVVCIGCE